MQKYVIGQLYGKLKLVGREVRSGRTKLILQCTKCDNIQYNAYEQVSKLEKRRCRKCEISRTYHKGMIVGSKEIIDVVRQLRVDRPGQFEIMYISKCTHCGVVGRPHGSGGFKRNQDGCVHCRWQHKKDLIGKRYGKLTVVKLNFTKRRGKSEYSILCKCDCGNTTNVAYRNQLESGARTTCGCVRKAKGGDNRSFKGIKELSGVTWGSIYTNAANRNIKFNITKEYAYDLFIQQGKLCALSGQPITLLASASDKAKQTASLDRIDSHKGYIKGNIQWVHKDINWLKNTFNQLEFINMCKQVANYNSQKETSNGNNAKHTSRNKASN